MTRHQLVALVLLPCLGCPEASGPQDDTGGPAVACPETWTEHQDGVWLQPHACLAWSPRSEDTMDWYAAASPESAAAGACGTACPDEPGWCDGLAGLGGIARWRLPSMEALEAAAYAAPPLEPLEGYLWSRDTLPSMEGMAQQLDLSRPSQVLTQGKDQDAPVRCVADLG